ncbi:MAG TPA: DUF488 domain-containing protein [Terriglobales bacterium]
MRRSPASICSATVAYNEVIAVQRSKFERGRPADAARHRSPEGAGSGAPPPGCTIYTIGHSNRSLEEFLGLCAGHRLEQICDVRTIPKSRHNPQFGQPGFQVSLEAAGLVYQGLHGLGGLRHAQADSINTGWRNLSFRGFADYMQTPAFAAALAALEALAHERRTAIMCAEAVPWRCHRSLIADALEARHWTVLDIMTTAPARPHRRTPFLSITDGVLSYPPERPAEEPPEKA